MILFLSWPEQSGSPDFPYTECVAWQVINIQELIKVESNAFFWVASGLNIYEQRWWRQSGFVFHINDPEEIYFLATKFPRITALFVNTQNCSKYKLASSSPQ